MRTLIRDTRYGLRMLAGNPGFTAAAVLCLALGIGATTAIFSVVNAVVLRPLPYAEAGRLERVFTEFPTFPNGGLRHFWMSPPEYFDLKRDAKSWDAFEGWVIGGVNLAGADEPIRATAANVTGGLLQLLGVPPIAGRLLNPSDDVPNAPATAVLSYGLWQRAYGGDPGVIGRDIRLNGLPCVAVGVMPRSFVFPPGEVDPAELWTPLQLDPAHPGGRGSHFLSIVARLRPGVTMAQAQSEMVRYVQRSSETIARNQHPFDPKNHTIVLADFQDEVVKSVRPAMFVLLGAVGFVLLIACVNVANLLLARSEARRREIAVRAAIGASLENLLRQFIVEGVLLSLTGAVFGVALAFGGLRLLVATNAGSIPRVEEVAVNWQVLAFALAISIATGIAFGLAPLLHLKIGNLHDTLKAAAGRMSGSTAANRFRAFLVTAELALALVLLIGAGLMVKAFWKLQEVDAGLRPDHVLTMRVALPMSNYRDAASRNTFWSSLLAQVNSLPGVVSASMAAGLPPARRLDANDTPIEGFVPVPNGPLQNVDFWNFVGPRYFETVGARLIEGRFVNQSDGIGATPTVVVNQTLARTFWPRESAVGHRLRAASGNNFRTIVGVVADIKNAGLDRATGTELFIPYLQVERGVSNAYLFIRAQGNEMSLAHAVELKVRGIDRALPVSSIRSLDDVLGAARSRPRFLTLLLTMFSSLSLILAALGIYGVISYSVAQRTSEIGIRMALGAQRGDVIRMIGATGLRLALAGTLLGGIGAFALTRFLSGLLFGVSAVDPLTFLAMAAALAGVTMLACYVPARRASKVDPLIALRYE